MNYMSEAIISRRSGNTSSSIGNLQTELITSNKTWVVPSHKGNISVRIFGGGASGNGRNGNYMWRANGGGSGWMNNKEFNNLTNGQIIQITIGAGGTLNSGVRSPSVAGGTTSFGTYLSANGGSGTNGGAGGGVHISSNSSILSEVGRTVRGGKGYQFGGGGLYLEMQYYSDQNSPTSGYGGDGGMWGGGGGAYCARNGLNSQCTIYGGNGGTYGGGGASSAEWISSPYRVIYANYGRGGTYGGNGGQSRINTVFNQTSTIAAENGTNTQNNSSVQNNLRGRGLCGGWSNSNQISLGGGGGFGGNGGIGGGGYGGNGGGSTIGIYDGGGCGGGGGYGQGADGGDGSGGGGGYFARGGDGDRAYTSGGGGGFGCGADSNNKAGFGGGGAMGNYGITEDKFGGGDGICIIQYYT